MKFRFFLLLAHLLVIFECQHSLNCATRVPKQIRNCFKNVNCLWKSKQDLVSAERDCTIGRSEALNDHTCIYACQLTSLFTNQRGFLTKQTSINNFSCYESSISETVYVFMEFDFIEHELWYTTCSSVFCYEMLFCGFERASLKYQGTCGCVGCVVRVFCVYEAQMLMSFRLGLLYERPTCTCFS